MPRERIFQGNYPWGTFVVEGISSGSRPLVSEYGTVCPRQHLSIVPLRLPILQKKASGEPYWGEEFPGNVSWRLPTKVCPWNAYRGIPWGMPTCHCFMWKLPECFLEFIFSERFPSPFPEKHFTRYELF